MQQDSSVSRRTAIRLLGGATTTALVAGCLDSFDEGETADDAGSGDDEADDAGSGDDEADNAGSGDDEADDAGSGDDATDDGEPSEAEAADETESDDHEDDDADEETDESDEPGFEIEPGTRITLFGNTAGWEGVQPVEIQTVENPTLVLEAGGAYEIGWQEGDGAPHNIEIRNENAELVDDLSTDLTDDPAGDEQYLEFVASAELATYVCAPHEATMRGEISVKPE